MKRFAFRLGRVARVREIERDRARAAWAEARASQTAAEQRLDEVRQAAEAESVGIRVGASQATSDVRALAFRASLRARAAEIALHDLTVAGEQADARAEELLVAARRLDALEKLRTRQRETHDLEVRRAEAAMLDDLATIRAGRPSGGLS